MNSPRITYIPRPDATPESEISTLADVYAFVLKCSQEKRKAGETSAGNEEKGPRNDLPATKIIPR